MIRVHHIGTTTVQGPAHDMPRPFDPATHIPPQERAAEAHGAVSAGADSHGATSPSEAAHSEAMGHCRICLRDEVQASGYCRKCGNWSDPQAHNADRAQIAALGADPVPAARRSPLEHERDAGEYLPYRGRLWNGVRPIGSGIEDVAAMGAAPEDRMREIAIAYKAAYGSAIVDLNQARAELAASQSHDTDANAACRQPESTADLIDPASEVAWLRKIGIKSAADLIEALVAECSREFGRGYEVGRAVGALEGPRPMTEGKA